MPPQRKRSTRSNQPTSRTLSTRPPTSRPPPANCYSPTSRSSSNSSLPANRSPPVDPSTSPSHSPPNTTAVPTTNVLPTDNPVTDESLDITSLEERALAEVATASETIVLTVKPFHNGLREHNNEREAECWAAACTAAGIPQIPIPSQNSTNRGTFRSLVNVTRYQLWQTAKQIIRGYLSNLKDSRTKQPFTPAQKAKHVQWLLEQDRYTCGLPRASPPQQRFRHPLLFKLLWEHFFATIRRHGHTNPGIKEKFNGVFICLLATNLHHALTAWEFGEEEIQEQFRESSVGDIFLRHTSTWEKLSSRTKQLLIESYKWGIEGRLVSDGFRRRVEPTDGFSEPDEDEACGQLQEVINNSKSIVNNPSNYRGKRRILHSRSNSSDLTVAIDEMDGLDEVDEGDEIDDENLDALNDALENN
jgi:hypothetical protein